MWRIASLNYFNGKAEDALQSTSMHLSFTDWGRPLNVSSDQGNLDAQFSMMEAVVSIREGGKWIGDVDLLRQLRSPRLYHMSPQAPCEHPPGTEPGRPMTSIESWDELRDMPPGVAVVRAYGNWLARLAVAGFLAQNADEGSMATDRITLCPTSVCWRCHQPASPRNVYIY